MKKVLYFGWLGHKNIGDELMWEVFQEKFRKRFGSEEYLLVPSTKKIRNRIKKDNDYLRGFDVIVLGGGSILMPTFINILYKAIHLRNDVEILIWGSGIDWIEKRDLNKHILKNGKSHSSSRTEFNRFPKNWYKQKLQAVLNHCKFIGLRGSYTYEILDKKGVNLENAIVTGDPGLLLNVDPHKQNVNEQRDQKLVAINWGTAMNRLYGKNEAKVEQQLIRAIRDLSGYGYKFIIFPVWTRDIKPCIRLYQKLADVNDVHLITKLYNQYQLMELFEKCAFSINLKLHANVLSAITKTPFVALGYRFKTFDFAHSIGLDSLVVPTDNPNLAKAVLSSVQFIEQNGEALIDGIEKYQQQCEEQLDRVFEYF